MRNGQFLEMLVECFGKLLVSEDISVTKRKKFYSNKTQIAEVDIVIQGKFNSTNIMIGIECRNRNGKGDRNWIREIIGKRIDLAEYGFTHWIAVSYEGFAKSAKELAQKQNVTLLVPGKVQPVEPNNPGVHNWMEYSISYPVWEECKMKVETIHESEKVSNYLTKQIEEKPMGIISIRTSTDVLVPLSDFINSQVQTYYKNYQPPNPSVKETKTFAFDCLNARIEDIDFELRNLEIEVTVYKKTILPEFRLMAFTVPGTSNVLGMIGINEYKHTSKSKSTYLMVGLDPKDISKMVMIHRDSEGNVLPNPVSVSVPVYSPNELTTRVQIRINP